MAGESSRSGGKTVAVSLLPYVTDVVVALGLSDALAGRTHECIHPSLSSVPACTKPKLAPVSSVLSPSSCTMRPITLYSDCHTAAPPQDPLMSPLETHMAQSTVKAAAWELCWGVGVPSACGHVAERGDSGLGSMSRAASLLVEWALSPFLTDPFLLRKLQPDVILTQLQPVDGAFSSQDIKAALEEVMGKPVMVVHLDPLSLPAVFGDVVRISRSLGAEDMGKEAVREMRRIMGVVRSMCSGRPKIRVLCLQWLDPVFTAGAWVPQLIRLAGGIPAGPGFSDTRSKPEQDLLESWAPESEESRAGEAAQEVTAVALSVFVQQVDVVVIAICGCNLAASVRQVEALLHKQGNALAAAASHLRLEGSRDSKGEGGDSLPMGRRRRGCPVAVVDGDALFSRPGPGLLPSLEVLAEILHPEIQGFGHEGHAWRFV